MENDGSMSENGLQPVTEGKSEAEDGDAGTTPRSGSVQLSNLPPTNC